MTRRTEDRKNSVSNPNMPTTVRPRELLPVPSMGGLPNSTASISAFNQNNVANSPGRRSIPGFVSKLYRMVNEGTTLIRWSNEGTSFIVVRPEEFSRTVLPRYFKHNNFSSFVRQLNMYGFHKVPQVGQGSLSSEEQSSWEFTNPNFIRGRPDLLLQVRRKSGAKEDDSGSVGGGPSMSLAEGGHGIQSVLRELAALRMQQSALRSDLSAIQKDSQLLWSETIAARERHQQQQAIIDKILRFLASVFSSDKNLHGNNTPSGINVTPRKRPLMIEEIPSNPSPAFISLDMPEDLFNNNPPNQERIFDALKTAEEMQGDLDFLVDNLDPALLNVEQGDNTPLDIDWDSYANLYPPSQGDETKFV